MKDAAINVDIFFPHAEYGAQQLGEKAEITWSRFKEFKFVLDNLSDKGLSHSLGTYLSSMCYFF